MQKCSLACLRSRAKAECNLGLAAQLSEKRIEDLVKLAGYKMLGRVQRTARNPSAVLSARLARSDTMRCAQSTL
jgi:hypothetical protein